MASIVCLFDWHVNSSLLNCRYGVEHCFAGRKKCFQQSDIPIGHMVGALHPHIIGP